MKFLIGVLAIVGGVVFINSCAPSLWNNSITLVNYHVPIGILVLIFIGYLAIKD